MTVQSSTESAQDSYLDAQEGQSEGNSQSGLSTSTESLESTRAPSVTRICPPTPIRQIPPEVPPKNAAVKSIKEEPRAPEPLPKRKLSSIGIQVSLEHATCMSSAGTSCFFTPIKYSTCLFICILHCTVMLNTYT